MTGALNLFDGDKKQASQVLCASASSSKLRQIRGEVSNKESVEEMKTPSASGAETSRTACLSVQNGTKDGNEFNKEKPDQHFSEERRKLSLTPQTGSGVDLCEANEFV